MRKKAMIFSIGMLVCFVSFGGCNVRKGDGQNANSGNAVEIDVPDQTGNADEPSSDHSLPDGFSYQLIDPENSDGIVVTPKK